MCCSSTPETEGCKHSCVLRWKYEGSEPLTFLFFFFNTPHRTGAYFSFFNLSWLSAFFSAKLEAYTHKTFITTPATAKLLCNLCPRLTVIKSLQTPLKWCKAMCVALRGPSSLCLQTSLNHILLSSKSGGAARYLRVMTKWGRNPQQLYKHRCAPHEINMLQLGGSALSTTRVFKWERRIWTPVLTETWQDVEFVHKKRFPVLYYKKKYLFPTAAP